MDEMVLKVQQWVNRNYEGRSGFTSAPETGKTGWSTMYALIRALQIELGITTPSNNFGDGTKAAYEKNGFLKEGDSRTNMVYILQGALWCKGYSPGGFTGTFGKGTKAAVTKIQTDAGLPQVDGIVHTHVFKAILTMDAYVLISGGDPKIRLIQQRLNNKYYTTAGVQPADGYYSRSTNKALLYGLQTEIGIPASSQTGTFGPATKSRVPNLSQGSSQVNFVKLLQYAMYVNKYNPGNFDGVYDSRMTSSIKEFQSFVVLPVTGLCDMPTWASLLVSTGDSSRKGTACDCITEVTKARGLALKKAGYETVGRYLTNASESSLNKKIQPGELKNIFDSGLTVFPIYQTYGGSVGYFNREQGKKDAQSAYDAAKSFGFKNNTTIYFAVDFDAYGTDITNNIIPHFRGINERMIELGGSYKIGIYGPRNVCIQVSERGLAVLSFVSGMSTGFSGNLGYPLPSNWAFDQISTINVGSGEGYINIDNNIKSGRDNGSSEVGNLIGINDEFFNQLGQISLLAIQYSQSDIYNPNYLVTNYYRRKAYTDSLWALLAGSINKDFEKFVNSSLGDQEFVNGVDPVTRMPIDSDHMFATLSALLYANLPLVSLTVKDLAGWAGDLITVAIDVYKHKDNPKYDGDVYKCALDYIGTKTKVGYFPFEDLLADVDAINISKPLLEDTSKLIYPVTREYYEGNVSSRFTQFFKNRFNENEEILRKQARDYMVGIQPDIWSARNMFKKVFNVPDYNEDEGIKIANAFADLIISFVDKEKN